MGAKHESQIVDDLRRVIDRYRFGVCLVGYGGCSTPGCCGPRAATPWMYTVGLSRVGLPELVLMGGEMRPCWLLVNLVAERRLSGMSVPLGTPLQIDGLAVRVEEVPGAWLDQDLDRMASWFRLEVDRRPDFDFLARPEVQQVVWADGSGRFPDDAGCSQHVVRSQPLLKQDWTSFPAAYDDAPPRAPHRRRGR